MKKLIVYAMIFSLVVFVPVQAGQTSQSPAGNKTVAVEQQVPTQTTTGCNCENTNTVNTAGTPQLPQGESEEIQPGINQPLKGPPVPPWICIGYSCWFSCVVFGTNCGTGGMWWDMS